ncbi:EsaB/YukD family protein [Clostridium estertheticum]|uniref:EsaB/YukD family protein n=1 Tax=Clostridium estertheticum TaxID=238834 RepID=UPI001C0B2D1B|nr:EsaB/YukD family protein [Clostridium estertheticum]MBU3215893.1 EsaB/YukD family protein [Clostridium estertheticum]WAG54119.1 EsaB/YukD family protein [Clostridium estertheticum]
MDKIVVVIYIHKSGKKFDVEIPLDITAKDLVVALNQAFNLGIDVSSITECYLKTENPIALLKGNTKLKDYKLRNGTVINITG